MVNLSFISMLRACYKTILKEETPMDQNHQPDVNKQYSQPNIYTLWNAPLVNHFKGSNLLYSLRELEDTLHAKYSLIQHPAALPIMQLLKASSNFLNQTNLEKGFSQSAVESKTEGDWKKIFSDITNAILTAQQQCSDELKNSQGRIVLESAIQYSKNCIALRIHAIERSQGKINQIFLKYGDEIRKIMAGPATPFSYRKI